MMARLSWYGLAGLVSSAVASGQLTDGFQSPPLARYGAKFRYWLPDANVDHDVVANDIRALKEIGAGGLEFLPFYNYGFPSPGITEWDTYAFGKPAFKDVMMTALEACQAHDLAMDFAIGASQGQGVPVEPLTPGLAVQLVYGSTTLEPGESFDGALPEPVLEWNQLLGFMHEQEVFGGSRLIGASAGAVRSVTKLEDGKDQVALDEATLTDLSELVVDGKLTWTPPTDDGEYVVFAFYERFTNQRSCDGVPTDTIANGSWVTDHFSAAGTRLVTEFWEEHLLDTSMRDLLRSVGHHSWEDSMEIQAALYWTPDFIDRFVSARGYNPVKYLPLLFHQSTSFQSNSPPYNTTFYLDGTGNSGQTRYLQDYRLTLNEGYMEYLDAYDSWAKSLDISHSCQVGYGVPLDMLAAIPHVSQPETESLNMGAIDTMLQFVGPTHLSGGHIIVSTEIGAVPTGGYTMTLPSLVKLFHDAFASGVNQMVIHGMPYGGEQPGTTWPGYTPFQYMYSELWSPRQPSWGHMSDIMAYTARNQLFLQSGTAKRDLAFYMYKDPWTSTMEFNGSNIRQKGFSFEYLSPANLESEDATVSDGVLAPHSASYRALIFNNQTFISAQAAEKVLEFAQAGLPIVFVGAIPNTTIGSSGQDVVSECMVKLNPEAFPNVKLLQTAGDLPKTLDLLSIQPRLKVESSEPPSSAESLYSLWLSEGPEHGVFLYNTGPSATYRVVVEADENMVPYRLNAWTGEQEAIVVFERSPSGIHLDMSFQEHQSTILRLSPQKLKRHVISHSTNVVGVSQGPGKGYSVLIDGSHAASVSLSDGSTRDIPSLPSSGTQALPRVSIGKWNLTIESWVPGTDPSDTKSAKELLHLGPQATLLPWSEIPEVANVSGVGIYTASFVVPKPCKPIQHHTALTIHFGPVMNTLRAWVNDEQLPSVDIFDPQVDITEFVVPGTNTIRVETTSTLFNAVKARVDSVQNFGTGPLNPGLYSAVDWQPHGLVGPVEIKTARKVEI